MNTREHYAAATEEYLRRLRFNNLSEKTLENYSRVLAQFGTFLQKNPETDDLFSAVELWRDGLLSGGAKPSTVKQYLTTLKIFFDRATRRSFPERLRFSENPVDEDMKPKTPERPYEIVLTDEQVKSLYRNAPPPHFCGTWPRNWAMIQLCMNEKIRNAELLDLRLSDVDMLHHILIVRSGKGRKYREVDLCELSEFAIAQYLDSGLRPAHLGEDDYLFGTTAAHEQGAVHSRSGAEKWHRGTTNWLSNLIERTVFAVTGVHDVRSHDLRHVGARVCLNAGQSIEELQGQLGHAQINTTQIYTSRMGSRRSRESAKAVLAARDAAAEQMKKQNSTEQNILPLFA